MLLTCSQSMSLGALAWLKCLTQQRAKNFRYQLSCSSLLLLLWQWFITFRKFFFACCCCLSKSINLPQHWLLSICGLHRSVLPYKTILIVYKKLLYRVNFLSQLQTTTCWVQLFFIFCCADVVWRYAFVYNSLG